MCVNNNGTGPVLKLEQARILLRKRSECESFRNSKNQSQDRIKGSIKNLKSFRTKPKHPFEREPLRTKPSTILKHSFPIGF
jgi:hypothetical protein